MLSHFFYALVAIISSGSVVLAQTTTTTNNDTGCSADLAHATVPSNYQPVGAFRPTFYRILDESNPEWPDEPATEPLLTVDGKEIARTGATFKHQLDIEGSGRLRDGRIVNINEKLDGAWRYLIVKHAAYGIGEDGYKLIPYRTIAVDPNVIKLGTVLYLPALKGIRLPSGEVHDGFVLAHDTGQGIVGDRIDLFVGFEVDIDNTLTRSEQIINMQPTCVYQVDPATAAEVNRKFYSQFAR
jgi:3D (Asp-Asp-Asp) domain-containing protein